MNAYREELDRQAAAWKRKAALRALYGYWFEAIAGVLNPRGPTVELGCGCGALRDHLGKLIATDVLPTPWCDVVADAVALPFRSSSLGNVIAFDVLHHVPTPLSVLRECERALAPGGRAIFIEPYATPFARLVYGLFHHEPIDLGYDVATPPPCEQPPGAFANMGISRLVFDRSAAARSSETPRLVEVHRRTLSGICYPLVGGFNYPSFVPARLVRPFARFEDRILRGRLGRFFALRLLIVLERIG